MKKIDVLSHFGGVNKTARALGITHVAVGRWGEIIPEGRAYKIESMTSGHLKVNPADYATPANPTEGQQGPALEP